MIFEYLRLNLAVAEDDFNEIYPDRIRKLAKKHWTPVVVAKQSAEFLAERQGNRILDIGSGAGKFCMVGSVHTNGYFTGVEQRIDLVKVSCRLVKRYGLENVSFIHSNITSVEFRDFDAFYFFNSFYENLSLKDRIDDSITLRMDLYNNYSLYIFEQFCSMPIGTRLVTYHSTSKIIPASYRLQFSTTDNLLKFWEKTR